MTKKIKKALVTFALAAIVGVSAGMSACTIKTKHPRAKITISFNEVTYEVEYTLYRNMYPQTVQHFIELADAGFYNNTIIHNYKTSDWVGGAYSYNADESTKYDNAFSNTALGEYLEKNSKEQAYYDLFGAGKFSPSVYKKLSFNSKNETTVSKEDALPTLIGEFSANDHNIENNALKASYGTLKMFYYTKDVKDTVAIKNSFGQVMEHDYKYNCATSLFSMQVGSGTDYSADKYCVFGELKDSKAKEKFEDLTDAIADYLAGITTTSSFTKTVTTTVDNADTFVSDGGRGIEASFTMTSVPLIIKSVKIVKR